MNKPSIIFQLIWLIVLALALNQRPMAAEKVKLGTSLRLSPVYDLPYAAAKEQGYWAEAGLEVELFPFQAGAPFYRALAAQALNLGMTMAAAEIQSRAAGLPTIIVFNLYDTDNFFIWVRADSRFKKPEDLKGARIGVVSFWGTAHAYGRMVTRALGIEKDVRFISTGGIRESLAALKTGATHAAVHPFHQLVQLKLDGQVRDLLKVDDFRPKDWMSYIIVARADFAEKNSETLSKMIRALIKANQFINTHRSWAVAQLKKMFGFSEEAAQLVTDQFQFSPDGKINKKGLENLREFLIQYGIVAADKAPAVEALYTPQFTG